jgi:hypothetical protein
VHLLDDFIEHGFGVVVFLADEDVSHALSDELERLAVVFVLVEASGVVLEVDLGFSRFLLDLFEEKVDVGVGAFLDVAGDVDVGDEGHGDEEIVEELFEYFFGDDGLLRRDDHFEGNAGFETVVLTFQDVHVLQKIVEIDLRMDGDVLCCRYRGRKH